MQTRQGSTTRLTVIGSPEVEIAGDLIHPSGEIYVRGNLKVTGRIEAARLAVTGDLEAANLTVAGEISVGGRMIVDGREVET